MIPLHHKATSQLIFLDKFIGILIICDEQQKRNKMDNEQRVSFVFSASVCEGCDEGGWTNDKNMKENFKKKGNEE